ncbi:ubiquitin carboxyl-terminal hydrolase 26-like [Tachysurus fulvidraco]|uniref:ubiquitin carboxyl-terminal hydrolase 26-like n=1 Tax=Tachysurus fulvidraco TaxID=1234273 RepID=UPI001FEF83F7|nr:ubiquitin carboxyl-terminal hydrolase 26-like [Tachysurus fulvidraco]
MLCCPCLWWKWAQVSSSVYVISSESTSPISTETSQSGEESLKKKQGDASTISRWPFCRKKTNVHPVAYTECSETPRESPQAPSLQISVFYVDSNTKKENDQKMKEAERKQKLEDTILVLDQELQKLIISLHLERRTSDTDPNTSRPEGNRDLSKGNKKSVTPGPSVEHPNDMSVAVTFTDKQMLCGGLPNFGNNCYVNASLQCLFRAETFCQELATLLKDYICRPEARLLSCFVSLWKKMNNPGGGRSKDFLLLDLINEIKDSNPEFNIYQQNDAHEFLYQCLVQMEESGRKLGWQNCANPGCPVRANFKFKIGITLSCFSCGTQEKYQSSWYYYLSVPLVHNTLDQCLYNTVNMKKLYLRKCKVCDGQYAILSKAFRTLPKFLILQFNRCSKAKDCKPLKVNKHVVINPELQINIPGQSCSLDPNKQKSLSHIDVPQPENNKAVAREKGRKNTSERETETVMDEVGPTSTYRLISVLSHVGPSAEHGHFVSDCSSKSPKQWITYNDLSVTPITEEDVLRKRSCDAYVLLYERVSTG